MEIRTHKKPESIWLFDYTSLAAMSDCADRMVWLSERDWNMICNAILHIDRFRSRVFTSANRQNYVIATPDEFSQFQEWVSDLNVHLGEFPLCNDLLTQQNEILATMATALQALADKPCCPSGTTTGSRGTGTTQQPENPFDPGEDPDMFPPTFEDKAEWKTHQCNAAEDILNALKADLLGLSGLSYSATSPSALVAILVTVLLTPIPFDDLIAIAGFLIFTGYNYALLATMATQIQEEQDELRCVLYNSTTVESAKDSFLAELQEIAEEAFTLEADAAWVMEAISYFVTNDSLNRMFVDGPTIAQDSDCSSCSGDAMYRPWFDGSVDRAIILSTPPENPALAQFVGGISTDPCANRTEIIIEFLEPVTITSITGVPTESGCGPEQVYQYYADLDITTFISATNEPPQVSGAVTNVQTLWIIIGYTGDPGTVTITFEA